MRNDVPTYNAKVVDNYGSILYSKTNVDWVTAIGWCLKAADDWGLTRSTLKYNLENRSAAEFCHEEISEIRIDRHK